MHPLLASFPVSIEIPVQWGDMDAYGHVNNTVFFRYFESARMAYFERCGFVQTYVDEQIGAILHSTSCRFRQSLFYPDRVEVGARVSTIEPDRFTMEYTVVSLGTGKVAAEGSGIIVSFDYKAGKKTLVPNLVRERVETLQAAFHHEDTKERKQE
ncbi:MAG: thioesterase family protein [Gemmatimonadota bacterium]